MVFSERCYEFEAQAPCDIRFFLLNDTTSRCSSIQNLDRVGLASGLLISHVLTSFFLFSLLGHDGFDEKTRMNDIPVQKVGA